MRDDCSEVVSDDRQESYFIKLTAAVMSFAVLQHESVQQHETVCAISPTGNTFYGTWYLPHT